MRIEQQRREDAKIGWQTRINSLRLWISALSCMNRELGSCDAGSEAMTGQRREALRQVSYWTRKRKVFMILSLQSFSFFRSRSLSRISYRRVLSGRAFHLQFVSA